VKDAQLRGSISIREVLFWNKFHRLIWCAAMIIAASGGNMLDHAQKSARHLQGKARYIATPRVSKHRFLVWLSADVLANDRTFVFARDDDYFFGILQSRIHEVWSLATASRHGVAGTSSITIQLASGPSHSPGRLNKNLSMMHE
jgi:hypothetical protein